MIECLLSQCVVSAPLRGGQQPCGRAAGGGADRPRTNGGAGDAHGRCIPQPPAESSSVAACGVPEGNRPGSPTLADTQLAGGSRFPDVGIRADAAPRCPSDPPTTMQAPPHAFPRRQLAAAAPDNARLRCFAFPRARPCPAAARGAPAWSGARGSAHQFLPSALKAAARTCGRRRRSGGVRSTHAPRLSTTSA